jgi:hypothetical protein
MHYPSFMKYPALHLQVFSNLSALSLHKSHLFGASLHVLHSAAHFKHFFSTRTVPYAHIHVELVIGSLINVS